MSYPELNSGAKEIAKAAGILFAAAFVVFIVVGTVWGIMRSLVCDPSFSGLECVRHTSGDMSDENN